MPGASPATIETVHLMIRKASHVAEYAIFAALLSRAVHYGTKLRGGFRFEALIVFLSAMLYAASDEFHQSFVRSRGSSVDDVLVDGCGVLLGIFVYWVMTRKGRRVVNMAPD